MVNSNAIEWVCKLEGIEDRLDQKWVTLQIMAYFRGFFKALREVKHGA